jgi:hypothetical protein
MVLGQRRRPGVISHVNGSGTVPMLATLRWCGRSCPVSGTVLARLPYATQSRSRMQFPGVHGLPGAVTPVAGRIVPVGFPEFTGDNGADSSLPWLPEFAARFRGGYFPEKHCETTGRTLAFPIAAPISLPR